MRLSVSVFLAALALALGSCAGHDDQITASPTLPASAAQAQTPAP